MPICPACERETPPDFRFCANCGAELPPSPRPREVRKRVTILFCDLAGSTARGEAVDPETLRRAMGRYFEEARAILERHGGRVEKFIGDAVMAVFGLPVANEDDALRAVRAAAELRAAGAPLEMAVRIGVNTGEVVAGQGETLVTGDAVNVAARLEQAAAATEVLIGDETRRLVRDAAEVEAIEPLELKGKSQPVPAYRLVRVVEGAEAFTRRLDSPIVGRERELQRLRDDFRAAVSERTCQLFTLLGSAGVGKSRLVAELLTEVGTQARVLRGRCLPYGEGITYWPLVEVLKQLDADPDDVIGSAPTETQLAFRRLLERKAAEQPLVVVLDDLQWAEPVFLDLLEHVADLSRGAPIFLLCVARPELLDERSAWGGGKLNATTILLEPLREDDVAELVERLVRDAPLDEEARRRIVAAA
ncbi:MAG: AAA family ATPase, partial [Actinobacteria bacterium]|nr:AAA family ATPase [Actinomycetota bacterium]